MPNYRDEYYSEIDKLFDGIRRDPFRKPMVDPIEQELFTPGDMRPVGWVQNASSVDGTATVTINSDGITIVDGKIFLIDQSGESVLSPSGFHGAWLDFIHFGVYNGGFSSPVSDVENLTEVTEIGGADTEDEYISSLSQISDWIVETKNQASGSFTYGRNQVSGVPYLEIIAGGSGVTNADFRIYQDVPIIANEKMLITAKYNNGSVTGGNLRIQYQLMNSSHGAINSRATLATASPFTGSDTNNFVTGQVATAGATAARFVRVSIFLDQVSMSAGGFVRIHWVKASQGSLAYTEPSDSYLVIPHDVRLGRNGSIVDIDGAEMTFNIANNGDYGVIQFGETTGTAGLIDFGSGSGDYLRIGARNGFGTFAEVIRVSNASGAAIGFYGAAAVTKPTVSGSRGGNAALADLLTELATLGLITDSTS